MKNLNSFVLGAVFYAVFTPLSDAFGQWVQINIDRYVSKQNVVIADSNARVRKTQSELSGTQVNAIGFSVDSECDDYGDDDENCREGRLDTI